MSIYLKLEGISGSVTTQGYQHWIAIQDFSFAGVSHAMANTVGKYQDRITRKPGFGEIHLVKTTDVSTIGLFEHSHSGQIIPNAEIHFVTAGNPPFAYEKYQLTKVLISYYNEIKSEHQTRPLEHFTLNYLTINKIYIPRDQNNQPASPIMAGYHLPKAEKL